MDEYEQARFDLYATQFERGDWFTCHLYRLMQKADESNLRRLAEAFPLEAKVYRDWHSAPNEKEFFAYELGQRQFQADLLHSP